MTTSADEPVASDGAEIIPVVTWCRLCGTRFTVADPLRPKCPSCGAEFRATTQRILVFGEPDGKAEVLVEIWHDGEVRVAHRPSRYSSWGRKWIRNRSEVE